MDQSDDDEDCGLSFLRALGLPPPMDELFALRGDPDAVIEVGKVTLYRLEQSFLQTVAVAEGAGGIVRAEIEVEPDSGLGSVVYAERSEPEDPWDPPRLDGGGPDFLVGTIDEIKENLKAIASLQANPDGEEVEACRRVDDDLRARGGFHP